MKVFVKWRNVNIKSVFMFCSFAAVLYPKWLLLDMLKLRIVILRNPFNSRFTLIPQRFWISDRRSLPLPSQIVLPRSLHKTLWLWICATASAAGACLAARAERPNVSPVISAASSHAFAFLKRAGGLIGSESVIMNIVCSKQTLLLDCLQMACSKMPIIGWGNFYTLQKLEENNQSLIDKLSVSFVLVQSCSWPESRTDLSAS